MDEEEHFFIDLHNDNEGFKGLTTFSCDMIDTHQGYQREVTHNVKEDDLQGKKGSISISMPSKSTHF